MVFSYLVAGFFRRNARSEGAAGVEKNPRGLRLSFLAEFWRATKICVPYQFLEPRILFLLALALLVVWRG